MSDRTDQHLDLEELADVLAGNPAQAAGHEHAAGCSECSDRLVQLRSALGPVAASLDALRDPEVPEELGTRLHRAITREHDHLHPAAGAVVSRNVTPIATQRAKKRSGWTSLGPVLVGAAAVALVGVVVFTGGGDDESPQTTAAPEAQDAALRTSSSGINYDKAGTRLEAALPSLLSGSAVSPADTPRGPADPLDRLRATPALASCLAGITDPADTRLPLALDYARFDGKPALAVVLASDKAGKVDVFFVGPDCKQGDEKLLHFARVDSAP